MSRGVNKAIILGNLGQDPDIRYLPSGEAVANFSVATSKEWRDKESGEKKASTEWHQCTAFKKLAEICKDYITKGTKVYLEGELRTRKWTGKDNIEKHITEILVKDIQILSGYKTSDNQQPNVVDEPKEKIPF